MATIKHKRTTTASAVPTTGQLEEGELALNTTDGTIHFKNAAGTAVFSFDISETYATTTDLASKVDIGSDISIPSQITHVGDTDTYMQFEANDVIRFVAGGSTKVRYSHTNGKTTFLNDRVEIDAGSDLLVTNPQSIGYMQMGTVDNDLGNDFIRTTIISSRNEDQITYNASTDNWTHAGGSSTDWSMVAHSSTSLDFYGGAADAVGWTKDHTTFETDHLAMSIEAATDPNVTIWNYLVIPQRIVHEGDTDTYHEFEAADTWRVVTGGSTRMRTNNTSTTFQNGAVTVQDGTLNVGQNDTNRGIVYAYGDSASNGGQVRLYNGATTDGDNDYFYLSAEQSSIAFRTSSHSAQRFLRTGMDATGAAATFVLGEDGDVYGSMSLMGNATSQGPVINLYNAAGEDTDVGYHQIQPNGISILFRSTDTNNTNVEIYAALQHQRSTNNTILQLGQQGAQTGNLYLFGDPDGPGGVVRFYNSDVADGVVDYWQFYTDVNGNIRMDSNTGGLHWYTAAADGQTYFTDFANLENVQRTSVTANISRKGQHTIVETVATTNTTLTLLNEFGDLDVVDIHKQRTGGTLTITSANGNIVAPDGSSALSHTIGTGTAMNVRLFRTGSSTWSLSLMGAAQ